MSKLKSSKATQDSAYGKNAIQPDISGDELKRLCGEYIEQLHVHQSKVDEIARQTVDQSLDVSGEWHTQRHERLSASRFSEICKRRASYRPLTTRILYSKLWKTKVMRYGLLHESEARNDYHQKKLINTPLLSVTTTGLYIDTSNCWLAASPDGLVTDPSESTHPNGLLEIKCPLLAESVSLIDLCTKKEHKSSFCLAYKNSSFSLKHNHN